ncbi:hypothetical protein ACJJIW_12275 [Microbulbifer sp. JMSA004]|uniref:hypothetical protein n=1 Tax=unclassified Microbulbifer TaxID=2619833 RepID=UPI0024ACECD6|nr:hypothetical protein [Microbulbifer sp. VAAF005]WHI46078.1 hypothetical protein P0078_20530 [Microbulbifer sp. VAAF005]
MNKKALGINEIIILTTLLAMLGLLAIRFLNPEMLNLSIFNTRAGSFLLGCAFCYFTLNEFKAAIDKDEWGPNRVAGIIRVPLYLAAALFLFYMTASGGINA